MSSIGRKNSSLRSVADRKSNATSAGFPEHLLKTKEELEPRMRGLARMRYNLYYLTNYFLHQDKYPPKTELLENLIRQTNPLSDAQVIDIPRIKFSDMTPTLFQDSIKCTIPFIIEGLLDDTRILKWNIDYLDRVIGEMECAITIDKLFFRQLDDEEYHKMNYLGNYREVFDDIRSGSDRKKYIIAGSDALMNSPKLLNDLPIQMMKKNIGLPFILAQLFIGGKETGSPLHAASQRNLFLMVDGIKEWTVAHPTAGPLLRARMGRKAFYTHSPYDLAVTYEPEKFGDPMDIELLRRVPFMRGRVSKGDALFNPPWWWHAVKNITTGSIGVSTRWGGPTFFKESRLYSIMHILTPHQLRLGIHLIRSGFAPESLGRNIRFAELETRKQANLPPRSE